MLETIIVILLVLWLLGLVAGQTFGGILHVLLLVAVVVYPALQLAAVALCAAFMCLRRGRLVAIVLGGRPADARVA